MSSTTADTQSWSTSGTGYIDRAVSPVVGYALVFVLIVIVAGIALTFGFTVLEDSTTPQASSEFDSSIENTSYYGIAYVAGPAFTTENTEELRFVGTSGTITLDPQNQTDGTVESGQIVVRDISGIVSLGESVDVVWVTDQGEQIITTVLLPSRSQVGSNIGTGNESGDGSVTNGSGNGDGIDVVIGSISGKIPKDATREDTLLSPTVVLPASKSYSPLPSR